MQPADPAAVQSDSRVAYRFPESFYVKAQGHNFSFYPDGAERLAALLDLIGSAQRSLQVFYYLFDDDGSGTMVRDALVAAAQRGVDVQLIVDAFGNDAGRAFFVPLTQAGGRFAVFSPRVRLRYLVRNHQKLAIADGARVLTGGANVSDHYFNPPERNGWCDLAVLIEGPVVARFAEWFALLADWVDSERTGRLSQLRALRDMVKAWDGGDGPVRLLVGGPLVRRGHWATQLRKDLVRARRLDTVSAYFSPTRSLRRQIEQIASFGTVRMVMAGKSDIDAAIAMARHLYGKLLAAGARIWEYQPCKLHMKLIVVDDASYVGSANLDKRSLRINVELMVRIEDAAVAARLRELVDHLAAASVPVTREWYYREAGWFSRMRWWLAYWLAFADYRVSKLGAR
jgi:cardiolipin synthase